LALVMRIVIIGPSTDSGGGYPSGPETMHHRQSSNPWQWQQVLLSFRAAALTALGSAFSTASCRPAAVSWDSAAPSALSFFAAGLAFVGTRYGARSDIARITRVIFSISAWFFSNSAAVGGRFVQRRTRSSTLSPYGGPPAASLPTPIPPPRVFR